MTASAALLDAASAELDIAIDAARPIAGGDINAAWRLELGDGSAAFLKSRSGAPAGEFALEAAGLRWLAAAGGLRVPAVLATIDPGPGACPRGLVLEWVEPGGPAGGGEEELGHGLAITHRAGAEQHGAPPPGAPAGEFRLGSLALPVDPGGSWARQYAQQRLHPLAKLARERGVIDSRTARALAVIAARVDELAGPEEPPARLHGDLWSGNVLADSAGRPWLIDPAAHGGHRELDLAMLRLFGSPSARFLAAYEEVAPLADGSEERVGLWQLQPLLVHAILFGGSYGAAVGRTAARYAGRKAARRR